jgi:hypothetical protein
VPNYNLLDLTAIRRRIGRGVVFYAARWDRDTPLVLTHLGDTEGDITTATNAEVAPLTLPELSGPAAHEADYTGENPTVEIPLYLADPALLAIVSPTGANSAGATRRRQVQEYSLVIFPEALFLKNNADGAPERKQLAFAAGAWTLDGIALTAEQTELLGLSLWIWRGYFNRAPRSFKGGAGDASKAIETVSFQAMHHGVMPEGHMLYTTGDPTEADINLDGES